MTDQPRPVVTDDDTSAYTLSIEEVIDRYAKSGLPRTTRTIQRYCANGHLDAIKITTDLGEKYMITPASVARHIAQTIEYNEQIPNAPSRDVSRQDATEETAQPSDDTHRKAAHNMDDRSRPVATNPTPENEETTGDKPRRVATDHDIYDHPYVKRLEHQVEKLENRLDEQVRRTEDIQVKAQAQLVELQRMTAVGQSETLANFMLKAREFILGDTSQPKPPGDDEARVA